MASRPPWTRGWSVFTRPSIISGKPVTWATSTTATPASSSAAAVPPVDRSSTPCPASAFASPTRPVLSDTEISARPTVTISSAIGAHSLHPPFCCGAIARFPTGRNAAKGECRRFAHEKMRQVDGARGLRAGAVRCSSEAPASEDHPLALGRVGVHLLTDDGGRL